MDMMHPNDPKLRSFIDVDPSSDFPIQNLPYGVFFTPEQPDLRVGVAIGDFVLDLAALEAEGLIRFDNANGVFAQPSLNAFMALGPKVWSKTRADQRIATTRSSGIARQYGAEAACARSAQLCRYAHAHRSAGLHRFLFIEGTRDQCRHHVPGQGQCPDAELAVDPDWL
jgi:hypothetical protein